MKKTFILLSFIALSILGKAQIDPILAGQLQDALDNAVSNAGNNGVSAHVILDNGETWSGFAGVGSQNVPISDTTVFHGASTTKLNIAILLLLLAEEELVDLDASWNDYVNLDVAFDPSITVRQLLNHTSGIADYLETAGAGNNITSDFNNFFTPQYILENVVSDVPNFSVGTSFEYSNSNYVLAALVAEAVTGNPVHTELRNRIWNPLNMNHTYFGAYDVYTEPTAGIWWNFGNGLTNYSDMPTTSMLSYAYAAGNIVSRPADLALLLDALLNNSLLNSESLTEMTSYIPASYSSWTQGYGLGIHHSNQAGDEVIGHDGYYSNLTDMFHSMNCGFTLVTMTNTQTAWFSLFNPMYDILTDYCATVHVTELSKELQLTVFPNPTTKAFLIQSEYFIEEIVISDAMGKMISYHTPNTTQISLEIEKDGVYFATIRSEKDAIIKKIIVQDN